MKIPEDKRPICSCGHKMELVEFIGHYDIFNYWNCSNCDLEDKINEFTPDKQKVGKYGGISSQRIKESKFNKK